MKRKVQQDVIDVRVESGVLQPVYRRQVKFPALYSMKVGESFMILDDEHSSLMQAVQHCRRITNPKRRFSVRRVAYNAFRVWRIE